MTCLIFLRFQHHDSLLHCNVSIQYEYMGTRLAAEKDGMVFPVFPELLLIDSEGRWEWRKQNEGEIK